jgi:putative heme-binding domain-containing protein
MEYGNYGYTDEVTGAGWTARRTNMEEEIPLQHWHLNDPGVVPNILQTGAGSPSGITVYEGSLLPEKFQGQMIHAEPGNNVVRSYPVQNSGAGYSASIVNILKAKKDQWFRPIDVATAPDGSLFIADWYDPGVGGHQVGDVNRGRIYRVAPPQSKYTFSKPDLSTPAGAIAALLNPNPATKTRGWQALESMGAMAEEELKRIWTSDRKRDRAQAFWLLIKLDEKSELYIASALADADADIRILGIRGARFLGKDVLPLCKQLMNDESPQVRREVALAIRGDNSQEAAIIWTELAKQYDGDRWYLEALGISAAGNWDRYFDAWKASVGAEWNSEKNADIVWRSRSKSAMPLLATLIKASDEKGMLRYFRSFDFHDDPSKQTVLTRLVQEAAGTKVLYALKHMDPSKLTMTPTVQTALNKVLDATKGSMDFVELVTSFKVENRTNDLLQIALNFPDSVVGKESARTLLAWNQTDIITKRLNSENSTEAQAMIKALWPHMYNPKAIALMENVMMDTTRNLDLRKLAVKTFGGPWEAEDRLLELAKKDQIPADLQTAAGGVFQSAWRALLRDEAAQYLKLPGSKEGSKLPTISVLVDKEGDHNKGKLIFESLCANCHQVKNEGVNFGPDLSEIGSKLSREALYSSILFPDQGISFGYEGYRILLNDGATAVGRILSETESNIDLQYMDSRQSVSKQKVTSRTKLESSLMPSNLQSFMSEQELVDLVSYLSALRREDMISHK